MLLSALGKKLPISECKTGFIVNAPEGFQASLGDITRGILIDQELSGRYDYAHLFIKNKSELDRYIDFCFGSSAL